MNTILPPRLKRGDTIRVIAPSQSLSTIGEEKVVEAVKSVSSLGFVVTFSKNCNAQNEFGSSCISDRINDLEVAFQDPKVKAIIAARGGYNSNELLPYINWNTIKNNPKIFIGYSDITVLTNAIFSQTGLITYSGPNFVTFGQGKNYSYTNLSFFNTLTSYSPYKVVPSTNWDDNEFSSQSKSYTTKNYTVIIPGNTQGTILGGNLCSFNLLQGTNYFPDLFNTILFFEEDDLSEADTLKEFDRNLESLMQQPGFSGVRGIILGRFQKRSAVDIRQLSKLLQNKPSLNNFPVIADVDFGHTNPKITFPIGGIVRIKASYNVSLEIISH